MNYRVTSDNLEGRKQGDIVTDDDLNGLNIDALIEGEHITKNTTKKKEEEA